MCDTIVAVPPTTKEGNVLFGKNSDRDPNETHIIEHIPKRRPSEENVQTTYISIPQVKETAEILLCKPFWIWGAEMGANEYGVVIGNEAVYAEVKLENESLIGMDYLRLALERSKNASEAKDVITSLLEKYSQGGECGYHYKAKYNNSYIIADSTEAWVLETAGKYWIAEKVEGIRTISNTISIGKKYDSIHPELIPYAIEMGFCKDEDDFIFNQTLKPKYNIEQVFARGERRSFCTQNFLEQFSGEITVVTMMKALRNHFTPNGKYLSPYKSGFNIPCLHGRSYINRSQTTGSQVSDISKNLTINWITGTAAPCTSIFKPSVLGYGQYNTLRGERYFSKDSLWWMHEKVHRFLLKDYQNLIKPIQSSISKKEDEWIKAISTYKKDKKLSEIYSYSKMILDNSIEFENDLYTDLKHNYNRKTAKRRFFYNRWWNGWSKKAKLNMD